MHKDHGLRSMTIGANLKKYREAKGFTQQQVWESSDVSKSSYTSYEAGRAMPSADKVVDLARVLGISTDELLMDESELSVSEDMKPILKRLEALPEELRRQARIAVKGILFGFEQESLK